MNYKRATLALLLLLSLVLISNHVGFAASGQLAPSGQIISTTNTATIQPTPASQNSGTNSGDNTAVWIAVGVAIFAAVGGGTVVNNKNKKSGQLPPGEKQ